jgi:hypothetical protein
VSRDVCRVIARTHGFNAAIALDEKFVGFLRDIFGNPFRPVRVEPAWRRWNGGAVVRIAQEIADEQAFAQLPILGDALEEAGCTEAALLEHCRQPDGHVRGCWLPDLLLGKK